MKVIKLFNFKIILIIIFIYHNEFYSLLISLIYCMQYKNQFKKNYHLIKNMKPQHKTSIQTQKSTTTIIAQLRHENQKYKQALLYYKSKYLDEKKLNQITMEKLKKTQNQKNQLLRRYQQALKIVDPTQLMNLSKQCQYKDESVDYKNMSMTVNMNDMEKSYIQSKNLDIGANNITKNDTVSGFKGDLILQYIKKRKLSNHSIENNAENNNLSYIYNHSQNLAANNQTERKFMTLKEVNGSDDTSKQLNLISKVQKSKSSKVEEKRKSYFQKKKHN